MPAPIAIFCQSPLNPKRVEPDYADEAKIAADEGFSIALLDHDDLDIRLDAVSALRAFKFDAGAKAVYRGWMMRVEAYEVLFHALEARGIALLTSPEEYGFCHHGPNSYSTFTEWMPEAKWIDVGVLDEEREFVRVLSSFCGGPVIVKDWVKSQASGYWNEACYIPDISDLDNARKIISRFCELQGDSLVGGVFLKRYIPLLPDLGVAHEFRAFVVNGKVVGCWPRSALAASIGSPPTKLLDEVASKMLSPYASMDFGRDNNGRWWLLEVGDGQVSGLPVPESATQIYKALSGSLELIS